MRRRHRFLAVIAVTLVLGSCVGGPGDDGAQDGTPGRGPAAEQEATPADAVPFADRTELATVLAAAETALADPRTPDAERTRWARAQQQAYRDLAAHPRWRDHARERIPSRLRKAYDLTLRAGIALRKLSSPQPKLPESWRVLRPRAAGELRGYYRKAERAFGVPWEVLAAINFIETRFGRIHGSSSAGAQGPMQFMPETWRAFGKGDVNDPRDAILGAGRYLAASGARSDLRGALFAYNRSDHYVTAVLAYAEAMRRFRHYLDVYHRWQVYYRTVDGDVVLPEGYGS